jgi:ABC-type nitrate/sulfonate/bicarbonate transport system permease component
MLLTSVPAMMEWGLHGEPLPRTRALRWRLTALLAFVAVWSVAGGLVQLTRPFNPLFLPAPWVVVGAMVELGMKGQLWPHVGATLERVAIGFSAAALLAIALGLLAGQVRLVRNVVEPVVELLRPIPPLAVLPMFIVWVGIGEGSKVGFIAYATFFPMFVTTVHGVAQLDARLLRAAQSLGAGRAALFFRVILPAALPDILTGLRLGVALAFFVIVISEFVGAERGLGYLINDGRNFFLVPQMLGAAVLLGLLGYAGNAALRLLERRVLRWQHPCR